MITCRFLHLLASLWVDCPEQLPVWLRRHLDRCSSCRRAFNAETSLVRDLKTASPLLFQPMPPALSRRIVARARTEQHEKPGVTGWAPTALQWAAIMAMIGVCMASIFLLFPRQSDEIAGWPDPDGETIAIAAQTTAIEWRTAITSNRMIGEELIRLGHSVHQPLELELTRAVEDGHRLLAAVVQSCVPEPMADALLTHTRRLFMPGFENTY